MSKPGNLEGRLTEIEYRIYCFIQNNSNANKDHMWSLMDIEEEDIEKAIKVLEKDEGMIYRRGGDNWYSTYFYAYDKEVE